MNTSIKLTLFGTSNCHLCDEAMGIINTAVSEHYNNTTQANITVVDIVDHAHLYQQYSLLIPVLLIEQADNQVTVKWPFSTNDVIALLNSGR